MSITNYLRNLKSKLHIYKKIQQQLGRKSKYSYNTQYYEFETKSTLGVFKNYYSTLAASLLLEKLPNPPHKFTCNSVCNSVTLLEAFYSK